MFTTLIDFSQIALGSVFQFQDMLKTGASGTNEEKTAIIRHAILTSIKGYNTKFRGEIVLACDGHDYWRRRIFPHYKANRKTQRQQSDLDWPLVFDTITSLRDDLRSYFPFKVIHHKNIEGDDIIGVLCKWLQTNNLIETGLVEDKQRITIVSTDGDFLALQKYDNVQQWSPIKKTFLVCPNPEQYLLEKIAKGDTGDGIPNILSKGDVLVTQGVRQTKMTAKILERFSTLGSGGCETDEQQKNWNRNERLINLEFVPDLIERLIIKQYQITPVRDKQLVFQYLLDKKCRMLLDSIEEFF